MATTFNLGFDKAFDEATEAQSKNQAEPEPTNKEAKVTGSATTQSAEEKKTEVAQPPETSEDLLPQEEFDKLKNDPVALRKALNRAFTQKTQALAEQRKAMEPFRELVESLQSDPQGTVKALAERLGVKLDQTETKAETEAVVNELVTDLKQSLGPELDFLADRLAPALERITLKLAGQVVQKEIDPLRQQTRELREEAITQQITAHMELFEKKHPDFKKHEMKMTEIGKRLQPVADPVSGKPPTWMEYMEDLYALATKDERAGDIVRNTVERMKESANKADSSEGGVPSNRVTKSAPKGKSFDEAFHQAWEDASAGIVYE